MISTAIGVVVIAAIAVFAYRIIQKRRERASPNPERPPRSPGGGHTEIQ